MLCQQSGPINHETEQQFYRQSGDVFENHGNLRSAERQLALIESWPTFLSRHEVSEAQNWHHKTSQRTLRRVLYQVHLLEEFKVWCFTTTLKSLTALHSRNNFAYAQFEAKNLVPRQSLPLRMLSSFWTTLLAVPHRPGLDLDARRQYITKNMQPPIFARSGSRKNCCLAV